MNTSAKDSIQKARTNAYKVELDDEDSSLIVVSTGIDTHILVGSRLMGPDASFIKDRVMSALVAKLSVEIAKIVLSMPDEYMVVEHGQLIEKSNITISLKVSPG